jgi:glucose-6-phosphate dehydrogenase assembly protein OpcA
MATSYKVLGQAQPAAGTLTTLYTVPSSTQTVVSTLTIANPAATSTTYRLAIRKSGAAIAMEDYIAYDVTIPALDTLTLTLGLTLDTTDIVSVESYSGLLAFNLFGSEIS